MFGITKITLKQLKAETFVKTKVNHEYKDFTAMCNQISTELSYNIWLQQFVTSNGIDQKKKQAEIITENIQFHLQRFIDKKEYTDKATIRKVNKHHYTVSCIYFTIHIEETE